MKILVLGQSGSSGDRNDGVAWPTVFRDKVEAATSRPIELEHTMFYPTGDGAPDIAEKRVADAEPDLVIVPVGAWPFSVKFVWLRVECRFGKRTGRWFLGAEDAINGATYERGSLRQATNRALRWTVGKEAIGGRALLHP